METDVEDLHHNTGSEPSHSQSHDNTTTSNEGVAETSYADRSDLCQGAWLLYKYQESDWHARSFWDYFEESMSPPFTNSQKSRSGRSPLHQVSSIDDYSDDEASLVTEATTDLDPSEGATQPKAKDEQVFGPCGHQIDMGVVSHQEQAIEKFLGCGEDRRDGLLADCRLAAVEELRADGSLKVGGDSRARDATDWVRTAWPAAWGAEVRLTDADGKDCFLDTGETAVPREYRGERRSACGVWDDDDEA